MKTIKKACSGTSLYPKKSSVSSKLKAGGKVKKGGMEAYEKSSYDKKMDAKGAHGKEGSVKDMKADKAAAKKLGYAKTGTKITPKAKDGKWIQSATASIKKRGTKGVCTGAKFGGPTCKPGSKRYALAKTFKSIAKKKK